MIDCLVFGAFFWWDLRLMDYSFEICEFSSRPEHFFRVDGPSFLSKTQWGVASTEAGPEHFFCVDGPSFLSKTQWGVASTEAGPEHFFCVDGPYRRFFGVWKDFLVAGVDL